MLSARLGALRRVGALSGERPGVRCQTEAGASCQEPPPSPCECGRSEDPARLAEGLSVGKLTFSFLGRW